MTLGSLFAGIGGFDLAARWMGWETKWVSEIDPYASAVLKKHWPTAPNLGDITQITNPPPVDMLVGGFPCQDISLAGKGAGIGGERSGLWKHYARLIGEVRPRWIVAENVAALRSRGLDTVLQDLDALGYDAEWHCIPASYVGAPHRRDRLWIIAHPAGPVDRPLMGYASGECLYSGHDGCGNEGGAQAPSERALDAGNSGSRNAVAYAEGTGLEGRNVRGDSGPLFAGPRESGWTIEGHWRAEPNVGRVAHGVPSRVDRLKCLGNAIVPQVAYTIFQAIQRHEDGGV